MKVISGQRVAIVAINYDDDPGNVEGNNSAIEEIELSEELRKYLQENPVAGRSDYTDLPGAKQDVKSPWRSFQHYPRRESHLQRRPGGASSSASAADTEERRRKNQEARLKRQHRLQEMMLKKREQSAKQKAAHRDRLRLAMLQQNAATDHYEDEGDEGEDEKKHKAVIITSPQKKSLYKRSPFTKVSAVKSEESSRTSKRNLFNDVSGIVSDNKTGPYSRSTVTSDLETLINEIASVDYVLSAELDLDNEENWVLNRLCLLDDRGVSPKTNSVRKRKDAATPCFDDHDKSVSSTLADQPHKPILTTLMKSSASGLASPEEQEETWSVKTSPEEQEETWSVKTSPHHRSSVKAVADSSTASSGRARRMKKKVNYIEWEECEELGNDHVEEDEEMQSDNSTAVPGGSPKTPSVAGNDDGTDDANRKLNEGSTFEQSFDFSFSNLDEVSSSITEDTFVETPAVKTLLCKRDEIEDSKKDASCSWKNQSHDINVAHQPSSHLPYLSSTVNRSSSLNMLTSVASQALATLHDNDNTASTLSDTGRPVSNTMPSQITVPGASPSYHHPPPPLLHASSLQGQPPNFLHSPQKAVISPQKAVISPPKAVISPQKAVTSPQKAVISPQKAVISPQKAVISPQKAVTSSQQTVFSPQKAVTSSQQTVFSPQKAVDLSLPSATNPVSHTTNDNVRPSCSAIQEQLTFPSSSSAIQQQIMHPTSSSAIQQQVMHPTSSSAIQQQIMHPTSSSAIQEQLTFPSSNSAIQEQIMHPTSSSAIQEQIMHPTSSSAIQEQIMHPTSSSAIQEQLMYPTSSSVIQEQLMYPSSNNITQEQLMFPSSYGAVPAVDIPHSFAPPTSLLNLHNPPTFSQELMALSAPPPLLYPFGTFLTSASTQSPMANPSHMYLADSNPLIDQRIVSPASFLSVGMPEIPQSSAHQPPVAQSPVRVNLEHFKDSNHSTNLPLSLNDSKQLQNSSRPANGSKQSTNLIRPPPNNSKQSINLHQPYKFPNQSSNLPQPSKVSNQSTNIARPSKDSNHFKSSHMPLSSSPNMPESQKLSHHQPKVTPQYGSVHTPKAPKSVGEPKSGKNVIPAANPHASGWPGMQITNQHSSKNLSPSAPDAINRIRPAPASIGSADVAHMPSLSKKKCLETEAHHSVQPSGTTSRNVSEIAAAPCLTEQVGRKVPSSKQKSIQAVDDMLNTFVGLPMKKPHNEKQEAVQSNSPAQKGVKTSRSTEGNANKARTHTLNDNTNKTPHHLSTSSSASGFDTPPNKGSGCRNVTVPGGIRQQPLNVGPPANASPFPPPYPPPGHLFSPYNDSPLLAAYAPNMAAQANIGYQSVPPHPLPSIHLQSSPLFPPTPCQPAHSQQQPAHSQPPYSQQQPAHSQPPYSQPPYSQHQVFNYMTQPPRFPPDVPSPMAPQSQVDDSHNATSMKSAHRTPAARPKVPKRSIPRPPQQNNSRSGKPLTGRQVDATPGTSHARQMVAMATETGDRGAPIPAHLPTASGLYESYVSQHVNSQRQLMGNGLGQCAQSMQEHPYQGNTKTAPSSHQQHQQQLQQQQEKRKQQQPEKMKQQQQQQEIMKQQQQQQEKRQQQEQEKKKIQQQQQKQQQEQLKVNQQRQQQKQLQQRQHEQQQQQQQHHQQFQQQQKNSQQQQQQGTLLHGLTENLEAYSQFNLSQGTHAHGSPAQAFAAWDSVAHQTPPPFLPAPVGGLNPGSGASGQIQTALDVAVCAGETSLAPRVKGSERCNAKEDSLDLERSSVGVNVSAAMSASAPTAADLPLPSPRSGDANVISFKSERIASRDGKGISLKSERIASEESSQSQAQSPVPCKLPQQAPSASSQSTMESAGDATAVSTPYLASITTSSAAAASSSIIQGSTITNTVLPGNRNLNLFPQFASLASPRKPVGDQKPNLADLSKGATTNCADQEGSGDEGWSEEDGFEETSADEAEDEAVDIKPVINHHTSCLMSSTSKGVPLRLGPGKGDGNASAKAAIAGTAVNTTSSSNPSPMQLDLSQSAPTHESFASPPGTQYPVSRSISASKIRSIMARVKCESGLTSVPSLSPSPPPLSAKVSSSSSSSLQTSMQSACSPLFSKTPANLKQEAYDTYSSPSTTLNPTTFSPSTTLTSTTLSPSTTLTSTTHSPSTTLTSTILSPSTTLTSTTHSPSTTLTSTILSPSTTLTSTTHSPSTTLTSTTLSPSTTLTSTTLSPSTTLTSTTLSPSTTLTPTTLSPSTTLTSNENPTMNTAQAAVTLVTTALTNFTTDGPVPLVSSPINDVMRTATSTSVIVASSSQSSLLPALTADHDSSCQTTGPLPSTSLATSSTSLATSSTSLATTSTSLATSSTSLATSSTSLATSSTSQATSSTSLATLMSAVVSPSPGSDAPPVTSVSSACITHTPAVVISQPLLARGITTETLSSSHQETSKAALVSSADASQVVTTNCRFPSAQTVTTALADRPIVTCSQALPVTPTSTMIVPSPVLAPTFLPTGGIDGETDSHPGSTSHQTLSGFPPTSSPSPSPSPSKPTASGVTMTPGLCRVAVTGSSSVDCAPDMCLKSPTSEVSNPAFSSSAAKADGDPVCLHSAVIISNPLRVPSQSEPLQSTSSSSSSQRDVGMINSVLAEFLPEAQATLVVTPVSSSLPPSLPTSSSLSISLSTVVTSSSCPAFPITIGQSNSISDLIRIKKEISDEKSSSEVENDEQFQSGILMSGERSSRKKSIVLNLQDHEQMSPDHTGPASTDEILSEGGSGNSPACLSPATETQENESRPSEEIVDLRHIEDNEGTPASVTKNIDPVSLGGSEIDVCIIKDNEGNDATVNKDDMLEPKSEEQPEMLKDIFRSDNKDPIVILSDDDDDVVDDNGGDEDEVDKEMDINAVATVAAASASADDDDLEIIIYDDDSPEPSPQRSCTGNLALDQRTQQSQQPQQGEHQQHQQQPLQHQQHKQKQPDVSTGSSTSNSSHQATVVGQPSSSSQPLPARGEDVVSTISTLSSHSGEGSRVITNPSIVALGSWSRDQVSDWVKKNRLDKICMNLSSLDGPGLQRMAFECHRNHELFYGRVKKSLGLTMFNTLAIIRCLRSLVQDDEDDIV